MPVNFRSLVAPQTPSADPYAEAERRRALAEALSARASKPRDFGTMSTGQATTLGIAQLAEALLARRAGNRATDAENTARQQQLATNQSAIGALLPDAPDAEAQQLETLPGMELGAVEGPDRAMAAKRQSLVDVLASQDPRAVGAMLAKEQMSRAFPEQITPYQRESLDTQKQVVKDAAAARASEGAANREARIEELSMRLTDARTQAAERLALQRELAKLQAETARAGQQNAKDIAQLRTDGKTDAENDKKQGRLAAMEATKAALIRVQKTSDTLGDGGGPIEGRFPALGPITQDFDGSVSQLLAAIQSALRVPGIGSQSNMELQALMNALPLRTQSKGVRDEQIKGIQKRLDTIIARESGEMPAADASTPRSFATEAEAEASGVKGEVMIGGRKAVIE